jgi:hypothetical protein
MARPAWTKPASNASIVAMRALCLTMICGFFVTACAKKVDGGPDPAGSARAVTVPMGAISATGPSMATPVSTTGPAPEIPDESTQKLQDAVVSARGALKRCYEDALNETPYLTVEVEVEVHVDDHGHGTIKKIDGPPLPDGMKRCVTNVLTGIAYPPNFATDVHVPLSFKSTTL